MTAMQTAQMRASRRYDLGPTQLFVEAENDEFLDGFEHFLGNRGGQDETASSFSIAIRAGKPEPAPANATLLYSGPLPNEGLCDFSRAGQTYFMSFPEQAMMVVDLDARRADITVSPEYPRRACGSVVPISVEFALDLDNQQVVHAAGLSVPGQQGMILISAPSGVGKTTTALVLARAGLSLGADDIMVLRREGPGIVAWALPRALNVHRDTAALLPWMMLRPQWNAQGEQVVPRASLGSKIVLENRELPVSRLLLLQRGEHLDVEPVAEAEALAALAADNVRGSSAGITPIQKRRFDMLADLVGTVPVETVTIPNGLAGLEDLAQRLIKGK